MSALGQKQTSRVAEPMSALPPKADIVRHGSNVRFVPEADVTAYWLFGKKRCWMKRSGQPRCHGLI
jgi:hypothetical protein